MANDFVLWINTYFPHHVEALKLDLEPGGFHFKIAKDVQTCVKEKSLLQLMSPRGFCKSYITSQRSILWVACHWKELVGGLGELLMISVSLNMSKKWLKYIIKDIETNEKLRNDYGDLKGNPSREGRIWTQEIIELSNGATIEAIGSGQQARGRHPRYVCCDDVVDDQTVNSSLQREKLRTWFFSTICGMMKRGPMLLIGTPLHTADLMMSVAKDDVTGLPIKGWKSTIYRSIIGFKTPNEVSIWDKEWSLKKLHEKLETIGHDSFMSEFQCDPQYAQDIIFRKQWFRWFDVDEMPDRDKLRYIVYIDPAARKGKQNDYTAICLIATCVEDDEGLLKTRKGHHFVINPICGQWSPIEAAEKLISIYDEYLFDQCYVESISFQMEWQRTIHEYCINHGRPEIPILPYEPKKVAGQKKVYARAVAAIAERGLIWLNKEKCSGRWIDVITSFPNVDNDDEVDAFDYAVLIGNSSMWLSRGEQIKEEESEVQGIMKRMFNRIKGKNNTNWRDW